MTTLNSIWYPILQFNSIRVEDWETQNSVVVFAIAWLLFLWLCPINHFFWTMMAFLWPMMSLFLWTTQLLNLERYNKEQFRKAYHSNNVDFAVRLKVPSPSTPLGEGTKPDLFLGPIPSLASNAWCNRAHKALVDRDCKWLKCMLELVGLLHDLFTNQSGMTSLVTNMAAKGMSKEIGMLMTCSSKGMEKWGPSWLSKCMAKAGTFNFKPCLFLAFQTHGKRHTF